MPADGGLDEFLANISAHRGRPLSVVDLDLRNQGASGLWVQTAAVDYIVIDAASLPSQRAAVICHEVAHMLLGHAGQEVGMDLSKILSSVRPSLAARFLTREAYDTDSEHNAERLATQLVTEHARRSRAARLNDDPFSKRLR